MTHVRETEAQQSNLAKARKSSPSARLIFYELAACALCVGPGPAEGQWESGPNQQLGGETLCVLRRRTQIQKAMIRGGREP